MLLSCPEVKVQAVCHPKTRNWRGVTDRRCELRSMAAAGPGAAAAMAAAASFVHVSSLYRIWFLFYDNDSGEWFSGRKCNDQKRAMAKERRNRKRGHWQLLCAILRSQRFLSWSCFLPLGMVLRRGTSKCGGVWENGMITDLAEVLSRHHWWAGCLSRFTG